MRAFLATPEPCPPLAPLASWPRRLVEATVEVLIAELDRRDGDADREPEEDVSEFEYLPDADAYDPLDYQALPVTVLFRETRHAG